MRSELNKNTARKHIFFKNTANEPSAQNAQIQTESPGGGQAVRRCESETASRKCSHLRFPAAFDSNQINSSLPVIPSLTT